MSSYVFASLVEGLLSTGPTPSCFFLQTNTFVTMKVRRIKQSHTAVHGCIGNFSDIYLIFISSSTTALGVNQVAVKLS